MLRNNLMASLDNTHCKQIPKPNCNTHDFKLYDPHSDAGYLERENSNKKALNDSNDSLFFPKTNRPNFNLDDLVWAKLVNHPWWPCKIVKDTYNSFFRITGDKLKYYIEFIGPLKERTWVLETNIFKYDGIESFKTYAQDQVDRAMTKTAKEKLAERFQLKVVLNRREQWQKAVDHADFLNDKKKSILIQNQTQNQNILATKRKRDLSSSLGDEATNFGNSNLYSQNLEKNVTNFVKNENEIFSYNANFSNSKKLSKNSNFTVDLNNNMIENSCVNYDHVQAMFKRESRDDEDVKDRTSNLLYHGNNNNNNNTYDPLIPNSNQINGNLNGSFMDPFNKTQFDWNSNLLADNTNNKYTFSNEHNSQTETNNQDKKKRGRKPKSPQIYPNQNLNLINQYPDSNGLKFRIKLNNKSNNQIENLYSNAISTVAKIASNSAVKSKIRKQKSNRSRSSSSSRSSSNSSCSSSGTSRSSSNCSSSSSSSTSSGSSSCTSRTSSSKKNLAEKKINKCKNKPIKTTSLSCSSSSWSTSSEYDQNSPLILNNNNSQFNPRAPSASFSDIEKINLKKQNARKTSTSFSISSSSTPNSLIVTPNKKQSADKKVTCRRRNSKSLSLSDNIDLNNQSSILFDENNLLNSTQSFNESIINSNGGATTPETYLIDRYKYAVRHIKQGLSVEEACNKYRISKGALLKCLSGGTAPRGKKTRLTESEENEIVEWLINYKDLKYNDAIHLVFEQVAHKFEQAQRPNPFNNGKPSMDWWYDFLSRHPQIMASKQDWLMRGKVNDQYIKDVQSGQLKCTKFRRALLSAIQYIRSLNDGNVAALTDSTASAGHSDEVATSSSAPSTSSDRSNNKPVKSSKTVQNSHKENLQKIKAPSKSKLAASRSVDNKISLDQQQNQSLFISNNQNQNAKTNTAAKRRSNVNLHSNALSQELDKNTKLNSFNSMEDSHTHFTNLLQNTNNSNCSSNTTTTTSNSLNIDFNEQDLSSVSPISLLNGAKVNTHQQLNDSPYYNHLGQISSADKIKSEEVFGQGFLNVNQEDLSDNDDHDDEDEEEDEEEEEEALNNHNEDDINANVTFHTEIFNSELDENNYENLIDPNELIEKNSANQNTRPNHQNQNSYFNQSNSIYEINKHNQNQNNADFMFDSNQFKYSPSAITNTNTIPMPIKTQNSLMFTNQLLNLPSYQSKSSYNNMYNHYELNQQQNHLLVPDDDENENEQNENQRLMNNDDEDDLMGNTIDPSAFLP